jgi:hypothetical protein
MQKLERSIALHEREIEDEFSGAIKRTRTLTLLKRHLVGR